MPRMQVYLPAELYAAVKERQLAVSEILQRALAAELRRLSLIENGDRYLRDLVAEVGQPRETERARAGAIAARVATRARRRTG